MGIDCHYNLFYFIKKIQPINWIKSLFVPFYDYMIYIQEIFNNLSPLSHQLYHEHTINSTITEVIRRRIILFCSSENDQFLEQEINMAD